MFDRGGNVTTLFRYIQLYHYSPAHAQFMFAPFLLLSLRSGFIVWSASASSRTVLALLRSDPTGLLARDGVFDAHSERVLDTLEMKSSLRSNVRRRAKRARSSEPSSESVREGIDRLGPPVRRRLDLRSPTGTGEAIH
jgi:hypothetical protein